MTTEAYYLPPPPIDGFGPWLHLVWYDHPHERWPLLREYAQRHIQRLGAVSVWDGDTTGVWMALPDGQDKAGPDAQ